MIYIELKIIFMWSYYSRIVEYVYVLCIKSLNSYV